MAYLTQSQLEAMGFAKLGKNVRISDKASIYGAEQMKIGDYSRIDDFCLISGRVVIGRNVHVAAFCNVAGGEKGVTFDDFSGLAYGCHVFSQSDDYSGGSLTNPTVPDEFKHETKLAVHIGRHCIVGTNSLVFPGVKLGEGCAVGAMSMVTRSTEPWFVYFGCPAKKINARQRGLLQMEAQYLARENENAGNT